MTTEKTTATDEVLPPIGQHVIVQCDGFRCLGLCEPDGTWVDAYNYQALPDVLWFKPLP
jgi:hypothetical protein